MPELFGKPFKYELYAQVNDLERRLVVEKTEHRQTRQKLAYAQAKIAELELLRQQISGLASQDVADAAYDRYEIAEKKRREEIIARAMAS